MKTFWAPGRMFSEEHRLAIRYADEGVAAKRMKEPNFPKEVKIETEHCNQCGVWHITRQSMGLRLIPQPIDN
jgi:hypothetical protein